MTHKDVIAFCKEHKLHPSEVDIRTDGDGNILDLCVSFEDDGEFSFVPRELIPAMGEN